MAVAFGAAAALALGAYRVRHGEMSIEALLIVLMAGTEIFRPLRDLRTVLHQGLTGQAAAAGINALLDTPITAPAAPTPILPAKRGRGRIPPSPAKRGRVGRASAFHPASRSKPSASPILAAGAPRIAA